MKIEDFQDTENLRFSRVWSYLFCALSTIGNNKGKKKNENTRKKKLSHDQAIKELEERVKGQYQIYFKNDAYYIPDSKNTAGEIDFISIRGKNIDIYEVKTNE